MELADVTTASIPKLPRGVRLHFDQVRNAYVLLAPERAFNVDATAVAILQRVDGTRTIDAIARDLASQFQADAALIARDVCVMIEDLVAKRVVEA